AGPRPRPLRPRGMGAGLPGRAAPGRGGRADGPGQPPRLGHPSKCLPGPSGEAAAVPGPPPGGPPRRPRGTRPPRPHALGDVRGTPKISPIAPGGKNASGEVFTPGRHHWGDVFPCFFAGGGVRGGQVIGRSDRFGGQPVTEAYTPSDLAATIFSLLGIDPDAEFRDPPGRPYPLSLGNPIKPLLA